MDWLSVAEEYIGRFGWGASGRMGIGRMFTEQDKLTMAKDNVVASLRPRGILSGFLAVVPKLGHAVFLPNPSSKLRPIRLRMRLTDTILKDGAIFSAYLARDNTLTVEDVIVWGKQTIWTKHTFNERWTQYMNPFFQGFRQDTELQGGITIRPSELRTLQSLVEPNDNQIIEFIPNAANTKRILWIPSKTVTNSVVPSTTATASTATASTAYHAKKETTMGPDVYSVWKGEERLGIALVRTLEISRALRLAKQENIRIQAEWSKQFEKWEIKSILQ